MFQHKSANLTVQTYQANLCNISWTHGVIGFESGNLAYGVPRPSLKGNKGFCDVLHFDAVIGVNCCFSWIASLLFLLSRGGTEGVWWPLATSQEYCRNALLSFVCRGGRDDGVCWIKCIPQTVQLGLNWKNKSWCWIIVLVCSLLINPGQILFSNVQLSIAQPFWMSETWCGRMAVHYSVCEMWSVIRLSCSLSAVLINTWCDWRHSICLESYLVNAFVVGFFAECLADRRQLKCNKQLSLGTDNYVLCCHGDIFTQIKRDALLTLVGSN